MNDVTVAIPTYNQKPEWLQTAINSALDQSYPVKVIVVDDGSSDPVPVEGAPPNVTVIRHPENRGISAALNTSLRACKTDWWCWLSSDDVLHREKVAHQLLHVLASGRKCGFHRYMVFDAEGNQLGHSFPPPDWANLHEQMRSMVTNCWVNGSTTMIHRSVFERVGLFDETLKYGQDYEMWMRIGQRYQWHWLDEVLGARREGGNLTESIAQDAEKSAIRNAEDRRIREKYTQSGQPVVLG